MTIRARRTAASGRNLLSVAAVRTCAITRAFSGAASGLNRIALVATYSRHDRGALGGCSTCV